MIKHFYLFILFIIFSCTSVFGQGGITCTSANANPVLSAITYANQSTCGKLNNFANANGQDYLYKYCALQDGCIKVNFNNLKPGDSVINAEATFTIYDACPFGTALTSGNAYIPALTSTTSKSLSVNVQAGQCYYILVDVIDYNALYADCIYFDLRIEFVPLTTQVPGAKSCASANVAPITSGITYSNQTLCCVGNQYPNTIGNDWYYQYCTGQDGCLNIQLDSVINNDNTVNSDIVIYVFDTCITANAIASKSLAISNANAYYNTNVVLQLQANTCYYILISSNKQVGLGGCIQFNMKVDFSASNGQIPGANTCVAATPIVIGSTYLNHTLCCVGNYYTATGGNDWFYKYCPTQDGCLTLHADSIYSKDNPYYTDMYMQVFEGCPVGLPLVSRGVGIYYNSVLNIATKLNIEAGKCYYILMTTNYGIGNGGCLNYHFSSEFTPKITQTPGANSCDTAIAKPQIVASTWYNNQTTCCIGGGDNNSGQETWNYYYCAPAEGCIRMYLDSIIEQFGNAGLNINVKNNFGVTVLNWNNDKNYGTNGIDTVFLKMDVDVNTCYCISISTYGFNCINYNFKLDFFLPPTQLPGGNTTLTAISNPVGLGNYYLNQTTCCLQHDEANANGQDWIYYFQAPKDGCVRVGIDSFINGDSALISTAFIKVVNINTLEEHFYSLPGVADQYSTGPELFFNVLSGDEYFIYVDVDKQSVSHDICMNYDFSLYYFDSTQIQTPGGNTLAAAQSNVIIADSLYQNQTTCCMYNDDKAKKGQDWVYYYCATQSGCLDFLLTNVVSGDMNKYTTYHVVVNKNGNYFTSFSNTVQAGVTNADSFKLVVNNSDCYEILIDADDGNNDRFNCINYNLQLKYSGNSTQTPGGNTIAIANANLLKYDSIYYNQTTCCMGNDNGYIGQDWFYGFKVPKSGIYTAKIYLISKQPYGPYFYSRLTMLDSNLANPITTNSGYSYSNIDSNGTSITFCADSNEKLYFYVDDYFYSPSECVNYAIKIFDYQAAPQTYPLGGATLAQACALPLVVNNQYDSICLCCIPDPYFFEFCVPSSGCLTYQAKNLYGFSQNVSPLFYSDIRAVDATCNETYLLGSSYDSTKISFHVNAGECYRIYTTRYANACAQFSINLLFNPDTFQTPGGLSCATASLSPALLNTYYTNQRNCISKCQGNNIHNGYNLSCLSSNTVGSDYVYVLKPAQIGRAILTLDGITNPNNYPIEVVIGVYKNCNGSSFTNNVGNKKILVPANATNAMMDVAFWVQNAADSFYFVVDAASYDCFTYNFILQFDTLSIVCNNADFELGNTQGWNLTQGQSIQGCASCACPSPAYSACPNLVSNGSRHTIETGGVDYFGGFPKVFNGAYSVRLGDSISGAQGEGMQLFFAVDAQHNIFSYNYAVVFEDPGHLPSNQPFFRAKVLDANGAIIQCTEYCVSANSNIPGFTVSPNSGAVNILFKSWTTVNVDLSAYIGTIVNIQFENGDCADGGHFGYSYIDCSCENYKLNDSIYNCAGNCDTLFAPLGYTNYVWSPGNDTTTYKVVCPTVTTTYTLSYNTYTGCNLNKDYKVTVRVPFTLSHQTNCLQNGSAIISSSLPPNGFTYSWNTVPVQTNDTAINLIQGSTYIVTVSDGQCYTFMDTVLFNINKPNIITDSIKNITCFGAANGLIDFHINGGTVPYLYQINNGVADTISAYSNLNIGNYTVAVTDQLFCKDTLQFGMIQPNPLSISFTATNACIANQASIVNAIVTGGTAPYNYAWSGNAVNTSNTISLYPGTYTITITDANGCISTSSIIIQNGIQLIISLVDSVSCPGKNDAKLFAQVLNGGTGYTYFWVTNPVQINDTASNLSPGFYTVVVSDGTGCTGSATYQLMPAPAITIVDSIILPCVGQTNGAIYVQSSPVNTYTYSWVGFSSNNTNHLNQIGAGNYVVTATNAVQCTTATAINVGSKPSPNILFQPTTNIYCKYDIVTFSFTGADSFKLYKNNFSQFLYSNNVVVDTSFNLVVVGININGCRDTISIPIICKPTKYLVLVDTICQGQSFNGYTASGIFVDTFNSSINCDSIRTIKLTVFPKSDTLFVDTICQYFSFLGYTVSGTYVDVFLNKYGCDSTRTINLTVIPASLHDTDVAICQGEVYLGFTVTGNYIDTLLAASGCDSFHTLHLIVHPLTYSTINQTICQGQSFNGYTVSGTYLDTLVNSNGCDSFRTINLVVHPKTYSTINKSICLGQSFVGYSIAGTYIDTLVNANGCDSIRTINLTVNPLPIINASASSNPICALSPLTLSATGGISYAWSPGTSTGSSVIFTPNTTTTYTVIGTDANSCTSTSNIAITVWALPIVAASTSDNFICIGDTSSVSCSGALTYVWNPNGQTDTNHLVMPQATTIYSVIGIDGNNCSASSIVAIIVNPLPIISILPASPHVCLNSSKTITANGAATYMWNGGVIVNSIGSSKILSPLAATTYTVTGISAVGCMNTTTFTLIVDTLPIVYITPPIDTICKLKSTTFMASGAVNYLWNPSVSLNNNIIATVIATPLSITTYTVIGTDGNGCTGTSTAFVYVRNLPIITATPTNTNICRGDSILVVANGALQYAWLPLSDIVNANNDSAIVHPYYSTTYTVVGTDEFSCSSSAAAAINVLDTFIRLYNIDICEAQPYYFGGQLIIASGTYFQAFTTVLGCDSLVTQIINMHPYPKPTLFVPADGCIGEITTVSIKELAPDIQHFWTIEGGSIVENRGDTILKVIWNTLGKKTISILAAGSPLCDSVIIKAFIDIHEATANITIVQSIEEYCNGKQVRLSTNYDPDYTYLWYPGIPQVDTPNVYLQTITADQWVAVSATDQYNCKATDSIFIDVERCCALTMPNAFSPNRDGVNEEYGILFAKGIQLVKFSIFNRFGEEVFTTADVNRKWNGIYKGKDADLGVYQYMVIYTCNSTERLIEKGDVTLVR
jgi:gliding motility-associated-like protein